MQGLPPIYDIYVQLEAICRKVSIAFLGIGFFGNILIIIYFVKINKNKLMKMSAYHFLILQLATVDALICVFFPIFISLTERLTIDETFRKMYIGVKLIVYCLFVTSAWILMFISFLRYRSIVHPLTPLWSKRKFFLGTIFVFLLPLAIGIFEIIQKYITNEEGLVNLRYALTFKCVEYLIPSTLTGVFYFQSRRALKRQNVLDSTENQQQIRRRNKTALKTLKYLMIVYFWTVVLTRSLEITSMVLSLVLKGDPELFLTLSIAFTILFYVFSLQNNILNVVVYAIVMKDFRHFLKEIFQQCFICRRESS